jgi:hypothetical protein
MKGVVMPEPHLFEEMLTTYPAEKRELARAVYHRFADGDSTQFFSQLFLVLDVYAHYAERIPTRMIAANADSLSSVQEMREEISLLAKTIETRNGNITKQAERTDELCRVTRAKCDEAMAGIELTVKNLGTRVDTKAIVQRIENSVQFNIDHKIISPFMQRTSDLASEVLPTLEKIQASAAEAKSEWSKRIWNTAWTTSLVWSMGAALILASLICWAFSAHYNHKMAAQIANMARIMKFNQAAFHGLAVAQVPVRVVPVQNEDGTIDPKGFVLLIEGAYAAEMRPLDGHNDGCIFFNSSVPARQIQHLQPDRDSQAQATNNLAP